jgi:hypothetical protein
MIATPCGREGLHVTTEPARLLTTKDLTWLKFADLERGRFPDLRFPRGRRKCAD